MATTTPSHQSYTVATGYNTGLDSLYSLNLDPQKWGSMIDLYGKGLGIFQWLHFAGQTVNVKSHSLKVIEEGSLERGIKLGSAIATNAAGGTISFTVHADDIDSNSNTFLQKDDAIFLPPTYSGETTKMTTKYIITDVTAGTFTGTPLSSTAVVGTEVPTSTVLMASGGNFARGSDGPGYHSSGWYDREFVTAIKRVAFQVEGGSTATARYTDKLKNGSPGFFSKASIEADFLMDSAINDEIFLGETNTNSLTMENRGADDNSVYGTQGLWDHLETGGMTQTYVDEYTIADFDNIKDLFRSQGVIDTKAFFGVGSDLMKQIENSGLDFLKEYSGGTDLMTAYDTMKVNFRAIKKNGILFTLQELINFDNPVKYGLSAYNWQKAGFICPDTKVSVRMNSMGGDEVRLNNIALGYVNAKGEDRTRIVKVLPGVEGLTGNRIAVDTYDDVRGEMLSELMLIVNKRNQMIQVTPVTF